MYLHATPREAVSAWLKQRHVALWVNNMAVSMVKELERMVRIDVETKDGLNKY